MAVNRKYNSIYQVARAWTLNRVNIMQLVIASELKASILQNDGSIVTYNSFSEIPNELRVNLQVIRPKRVPKSEYNKLLQPWDQLIITDEEMARYVANNSQKEILQSQNIANYDSDNPKSTTSLLILVATMAIKGYRYNPRDSKSAVPTEIIKDAADLGLSINEKTVREWLKNAASLLESDKIQ